jgi:two-component system NtrC family sensor kinase
MKISKLFFLLIVLFLSTKSVADDVDIFSDTSKTLDIVKSTKVLTDVSGTETFQKVLLSTQFKKLSQKVANLGVSQNSHWLKFRIKNITDIESLILEIDNSIIDELDLYTLLPNGEFLVEKIGENKRVNERKFNDHNFIFNVNIPKNQTRDFYIKVKSGDIIVVPIYLRTQKTFFESHLEKELIFGIYTGIILVMFFYNLFLYFTIRDKNYLYYVAYIFSVGGTQIVLQGFSYKYLWPNSPWFANQSLILFAALSGISIVLFLRYFLQLKKHTPILNRGVDIIIIGYLIAVPLRILGYYNISYNIVDLLAGVICFYSLAVAIIISIKGYRPAKFFLLAWSIFIIGMLSFVFRNFGLLPYNYFTNYSMPFGNAIEVILLSFALADRINILKKEKEESQVEALQALKENERIIKEQNVILDTKVTERTAELETSNQELSVTLKNLKETQSKLVDAEKMASLGQLTAGIAHEINNPINFVSSSVKPLKRDIADILSILDKYDELSKEGNIDQKIKEVNALKKDLDIDYLREEINTLLVGIDDGANRTAEIVKGLRNFSRMDESDLKMSDIHEGINSSLVLLNSTLGGRIEILKDYGSIPAIECYAGKLNQVFMNILTNATQAISSNKEANGKGTINIKTSEKGEDIVISIKDSGMGMPEEVKNKIFEPFFTTKDVGEGTGLGLSIVFSIIEAHKGQIVVESEKSKGTEFIITLPKTQKN